MREVLLYCAAQGLFQPIWSDRIAEEWARVGARRGKGEDLIIRGEIARLNAAWPQANLPVNTDTIARHWLPDENDIHVLATAIDANAPVIVTMNLRDFPRAELTPHGITAVHPDAYLRAFWDADRANVEKALTLFHTEAERLAQTKLDLRALLKRARLPRLAKTL